MRKILFYSIFTSLCLIVVSGAVVFSYRINYRSLENYLAGEPEFSYDRTTITYK